jgi:hypothetical protein
VPDRTSESPQRFPARCQGHDAITQRHEFDYPDRFQATTPWEALPVGLGGGEVWLHLGCSAAWRAGRIGEAVEALALVGIAAPPGGSVTSEESSTDQTGSEG